MKKIYYVYPEPDTENSNDTNCNLDKSYCEICKQEEKGCEDDIMDIDVPVEYSTDCCVTTMCCWSPICPHCIKTEGIKTIAHHLFIEKVIYLHDDELENCDHFKHLKLKPFNAANKKYNTQFNWILFKPLEASVYTYYKNHVDLSYNQYGAINIKSWVDDAYWKHVCVDCKCTECGFKCAAYAYMAS